MEERSGWREEIEEIQEVNGGEEVEKGDKGVGWKNGIGGGKR